MASEPSPKEARPIIRVLAALSDENRFRIVAYLAAEEDSATCGAIGDALGLSPSLLSHHLAILAEAGIIGRRKNGLWTMNGLRRSALAEHLSTLQSLVDDAGSPPTQPA